MRQFPLTALLLLLATTAVHAAEDKPLTATLIESRRIWSQAPHNAFTDLIRFNDQWLCTFREGAKHVSPEGSLRIIASKDGNEWSSIAHLTSTDSDLRDPKVCITPDGRLMLTAAGAFHKPSPAKHQTYVWFSKDGREWTKPQKIGEPDMWLWRVTWHGKKAYGIGYSSAGSPVVRLYESGDGVKFERLGDDLQIKGEGNEASILFDKDGVATCLLRRDPDVGLLGFAKSPYKEWNWTPLSARIGGPHQIVLTDGRRVGVVRLYDNPVHTGVCQIDGNGKLTELVKLPSGGDTSYAGIIHHDGILWISYYSTHEEKKTSIYLAKVKFE